MGREGEGGRGREKEGEGGRERQREGEGGRKRERATRGGGEAPRSAASSPPRRPSPHPGRIEAPEERLDRLLRIPLGRQVCDVGATAGELLQGDQPEPLPGAVPVPGDRQAAPPPHGAAPDLVVPVEGLVEALEVVAQGATGLHGAARLPVVIARGRLHLQEVPEDGLVVVQLDLVGVLPEEEFEEVLVRLSPSRVSGRCLCPEVAEVRVLLRPPRELQNLQDNAAERPGGPEIAPGVEELGVGGRPGVSRQVLV
mmetsp:Transcript_4769/g.14963  ORF Transcript_4769/g.14963 Transcript_4769/m.14963 type:complete len:255 (-) Transcript_4769:22-786(-)